MNGGDLYLVRGVDSAGVTGRHADGSSNHDPGNGTNSNDQSSQVAVDEEEGDSDQQRVIKGHSVLYIQRERGEGGRGSGG